MRLSNELNRRKLTGASNIDDVADIFVIIKEISNQTNQLEQENESGLKFLPKVESDLCEQRLNVADNLKAENEYKTLIMYWLQEKTVITSASKYQPVKEALLSMLSCSNNNKYPMELISSTIRLLISKGMNNKSMVAKYVTNVASEIRDNMRSRNICAPSKRDKSTLLLPDSFTFPFDCTGYFTKRIKGAIVIYYRSLFMEAYESKYFVGLSYIMV